MARATRHWFLLLIFVLAGCRPAPSTTSTTPGAMPAASPAELPGDVATRWFDLQLKLIRETPGFTPPVASRALGYAGVTLYEAVVGGMPEHNSLVGQLNGLEALPRLEPGQVVSWEAVANSALATIVRSLYPTASLANLAAAEDLEQRVAAGLRARYGDGVVNVSAAYGRALAGAIFEWSRTDGGHAGYARNFPADYAPPSGPGTWVPTPPGFQTALQPAWGENRPFVLESGAACAVSPPPAYSEEPGSPFYAEALEVYATVRDLTPEQDAIARFWADDPGRTYTPPGHSVAVTVQVLRYRGASLALTAEALARVGLAVADAFIGCWQAKYEYNLIRPISYIQAVIDPAWNTPQVTDPVITPPFPEYPSGHSVQSAAAAAVLTALFGDDFAYSDVTHLQDGLPARHFPSFAAAAEEAAISRLYGGIHFRSAIVNGLEQGRCIGARVNGLAWRR